MTISSDDDLHTLWQQDSYFSLCHQIQHGLEKRRNLSSVALCHSLEDSGLLRKARDLLPFAQYYTQIRCITGECSRGLNQDLDPFSFSAFEQGGGLAPNMSTACKFCDVQLQWILKDTPITVFSVGILGDIFPLPTFFVFFLGPTCELCFSLKTNKTKQNNKKLC